MNIRLTFIASILALVGILSACGGGGGSTNTSPPAVTPVGSITTGSALLGKVTRTYTDATHATISGLSSNFGNTYPTVSSASLTSIDVAFSDAGTGISGNQTISTVGLSSPGITSVSSGNYLNQVGGTSYTYARFGFVELASADTSNNAIVRDSVAPFWVASVYSSYTPVTANYTGKLAGNFVINSSSKTRVICDVTVAYTAGTPRVMEPTISNCTDGAGTTFVASGSVYSSLTGNSLSLSSNSARKLKFTNSQSVEMSVTAVNSLDFLIGGPNGEELVGGGSVIGQAVVSGNPVNGIFVFAFGSKKS